MFWSCKNSRRASDARAYREQLDIPRKTPQLAPSARTSDKVYKIAKTTPTVAGETQPQIGKYLRFLSLVGIGGKIGSMVNPSD